MLQQRDLDSDHLLLWLINVYEHYDEVLQMVSKDTR